MAIKIETESETESLNTNKQSGWANRSLVSPLKKFWRSGQFMSFSALLISLGTFITFAYQNYLIQKQQYRSVLPYLMLTYSSAYNNEGTRLVGLQIMNNGVGPAFIEDLKISYQNQIYKNVSDFVIKGIYEKHPISTSRNEITEGYALPAGQIQPVFSSNDALATQVLDSLLQSGNLKIEITYSSLYEEKWHIVWDGSKKYKPVKTE